MNHKNKMQNYKVLKIASPDVSLQGALSEKLGVSMILAQILINRGIKSVDEAEKFLRVDLSHLQDPYSFSDMHKAVGLIRKIAKDRGRVMIFGDYDVDGITSVALLKSTLSKMGLDVVHYIPHRIKEGYGLNKNVLHLAKQKNIKLLITADCGTNDYERINELRRCNIEVIVTDHHEPRHQDLPPASTIINPKLKTCGYRYRELAGVGVVYKLCQAITAELLLDDLDLVSLGTIADVVPLVGENRVIAKEGLSRLTRTKKIGLRALMEVSGVENRKITTTTVSYILGPRINASGRLDSADIALDLLMGQDKDKADELAKIIETHNRLRQKIENKILEEAQGLIDREINFKEHKVIVIAKEDWHQGVLGIVASKLAEIFYRPTILISKTRNLCKGSGRSIKNFHLFEALLECADFLESFGGHEHAAGLVISKDNIEKFKNNINRLAKEKLALEDLFPSLDIDAQLGLSQLDEALIMELEALQPFGRGNPEPLFYTRSLKLRGEPQVLGRDTLKFWVSDGNVTYQAIGFGMARYKDSLANSDYLDLVYTPQIDDWQDARTVLLEVKEVFFRG